MLLKVELRDKDDSIAYNEKEIEEYKISQAENLALIEDLK